MLKRPVNVGFSGGEKKRAEMVQMGIMNPGSRCSTKPTAASTSMPAKRSARDQRIMRKPDKGVLLITHYQRLLDYVGRTACTCCRPIVSGGPSSPELEREGYAEAAA